MLKRYLERLTASSPSRRSWFNPEEELSGAHGKDFRIHFLKLLGSREMSAPTHLPRLLFRDRSHTCTRKTFLIPSSASFQSISIVKSGVRLMWPK